MGQRISVIIPTYERRDAVAACVQSLLDQTRRPDEIVFVDDSPGTHIRELHEDLHQADDFPVPVRFVPNQGRPSLTRSRNRGIEETDGELVVFFDSDCVVDPRYLEEAEATLAAHPDAMAVRGIETDRAPFPRLYQAYRWVFAQAITCRRRIRIGFPPTFTRYATDVQDVRTSDSMKGSNMVVRRGVFDHVRFDEQMERYSLLEDIDFALGLRRHFPDGILVNPRMRVDHKVDERGRIPDTDSWLMLFLNKHYLAHKHYRVGPLRRAKLWWSDLGFVVMESQRDVRRFRRLWPRYRRVRAILERHRTELEAGNLEPLNRYYSWMDGPDHGL